MENLNSDRVWVVNKVVCNLEKSVMNLIIGGIIGENSYEGSDIGVNFWRMDGGLEENRYFK